MPLVGHHLQHLAAPLPSRLPACRWQQGPGRPALPRLAAPRVQACPSEDGQGPSAANPACHGTSGPGQDAAEPSAASSLQSSGSGGGARTAWNKGQAMPAATRRKLSQAKKQQWKDPELRARVSAKLKGAVPWNKGRTLSEETRRKMSLAKLNRTASQATRRRMSAAHTGKRHSQETVQLLSQMAAGQPKSPQHKTQIAAGQRRRHAAARVLRAVEAVYEAQGATSRSAAAAAAPVTAQVTAAAACLVGQKPAAVGAVAVAVAVAEPGTGTSGTGGSMQPATSGAAAANGAVGDVSAAPGPGFLTAGGSGSASSTATAAAAAAAQSLQASRLAAYRTGGGGLQGAGGGGASGAKKRKLSRSQILAEYKAELREYRALQEELSPWSNAFLEKHGRKPGMQDVVATGIAWLIVRYKQYILLRDRLFTDTGTLRSRLDGAIPDLDSLPQSINRADPAGAGPLNANGGVGPSRAAAAQRFADALEYKARRGPAQPQPQPLLLGGAAAGVADELASPLHSSDSAAAAAAEQQQQEEEEEEECAAGEAPLPAGSLLGPAAEESPILGPNAPAKVRLAMLAAQEYRAKKAQATRAAAIAAAAAAKAGVPAPKPARPAANGDANGAASGVAVGAKGALNTGVNGSAKAAINGTVNGAGSGGANGVAASANASGAPAGMPPPASSHSSAPSKGGVGKAAISGPPVQVVLPGEPAPGL